MLDGIFAKFAEKAPVTVMMRALLENILAPARIDALFEDQAQRQYTRQLTFSAVVSLLADVVVKIQPSVHQAFRARREQLAVAVKSVYEKINGCEPALAAALVSMTARELEVMIRALGVVLPSPLPGYRVKILDGNHFAATDRRLRPLRGGQACLPGQALAVLDPQLQLILAIVPCEDAHTQERALVPEVLRWVEPGDLWIEDRNFCTTKLISGIARKGAFFVVRQHGQSLRWKPASEFTPETDTAQGSVSEQPVVVLDDHGQELQLRRIRLRLPQATRDGDSELYLLTNLPADVIAAAVAEVYRCRWHIEAAFQEATVDLTCEISTLGTPAAAILVFAVALLCYNAISVLKAALRTQETAERLPAGSVRELPSETDRLSTYYLADHIASIWQGMELVLPGEYWTERFSGLNSLEMASALKQLASHVRLNAFTKRKPSRRRPQASPPRPGGHVSSAKLLDGRKHKY
jgi:Transposase DDE domain